MPETDLTILDNGIISAGVAPLGAELQFLRDQSGRDLLWHGDAAFWTGRAPILFPIVGKAPDDQVAVNGQTAEMKQHGFARRSLFTLLEARSDFAKFVLKDTDDSRSVFPFRFGLTISYLLSDATLSVTVEVTNESDETMPFGLGFHPAFVWPLPGAGEAPHQIELGNGGEPELARLTDGFLGPKRHASPFQMGQLTLDHALFEEDAMIFPEGSGESLTYSAPDSDAPSLDFRFRNTPNLGIWTKPGAPFICIEPWHGMAARVGAGPEIAERPYSMSLAPGANADFGYDVTIR